MRLPVLRLGGGGQPRVLGSYTISDRADCHIHRTLRLIDRVRGFSYPVLHHHHFFFLLSPHILTSSLSLASFLRIFRLIPFLTLFSSITYLSHNISLSSSLSSPFSLNRFSLSLFSLFVTLIPLPLYLSISLS